MSAETLLDSLRKIAYAYREALEWRDSLASRNDDEWLNHLPEPYATIIGTEHGRAAQEVDTIHPELLTFLSSNLGADWEFRVRRALATVHLLSVGREMEFNGRLFGDCIPGALATREAQRHLLAELDAFILDLEATRAKKILVPEEWEEITYEGPAVRMKPDRNGSLWFESPDEEPKKRADPPANYPEGTEETSKTPTLDRLCGEALIASGLCPDLASGLSIAQKFYVVCYGRRLQGHKPAKIRDSLRQEVPNSEYPLRDDTKGRETVKSGIRRGKAFVEERRSST